jgi:hypothetical protein
MDPGCGIFYTEIVRNLPIGGKSKAVKVCGSKTTGPVAITNDLLGNNGLLRKGYSLISDVNLGSQAETTLYKEKNFDGDSLVIVKSPTKILSISGNLKADLP